MPEEFYWKFIRTNFKTVKANSSVGIEPETIDTSYFNDKFLDKYY